MRNPTGTALAIPILGSYKFHGNIASFRGLTSFGGLTAPSFNAYGAVGSARTCLPSQHGHLR